MFLLLRASSSSSSSSLSCRCLLRSNGGKGGRLISSSNLELPQRKPYLRWKLQQPSSTPAVPSARASIPSLGRLCEDFAMMRCFSTSSSGDNDGNNTNKESTSEATEEAVSTPKLFFDADDDARQYFLSSDEENNNSSSSSDSSSQSSATKLPPSYIRDTVTGKWTNKTLAELSMKDKQLLNLDEESKSEEVMKHLENRWREAASSSIKEGETAASGIDDGLGTLNSEHERLARRIQEMQLALGPIGRDPANYSSSFSSTTNDDSVASTAREHQQLPLTLREYQALKTYAQKEYNIDPKDFVKLVSDTSTAKNTSITASSFSNEDAGLDDLIPHNTLSSGPDHTLLTQSNKQYFDADLDLAYLNPKLHRRAYKNEGNYEVNNNIDDPLADILPSDLNPTRKVNRRHAQPVPKRLLHHNNLSLLRRYTTPGGKIMNRVQSRLGAKDQRKIAKLVKRARHLGLIPHLGQWKLEDHGYLYERGVLDVDNEKKNSMSGDGGGYDGDNETKKAWEIELEQRGLWPLQDDTEIIKKYYEMDAILEHLGGPKGSKKRETLDRLLGGPGALV